MTGGGERPPSFLRRHLATNAQDEDVLVALACDENMWVRRAAVRNPATPQWVVRLLVRAGADPELRGRGHPDPNMDVDELRQLVECGPWAQRLVADHPNASGEILEALARHPSDRVRASVAAHPNSPTETLAILCSDADERIRQQAATHERRPDDVIALMERAGADRELGRVDHELDDGLTPDELTELGGLGPWGRFLAARHVRCPSELLTEVASDPDWRVRSGVLDNPFASDVMVATIADTEDGGDVARLRGLSELDASPSALRGLAVHRRAEVRLSVTRHPAATSEVIGTLAVDRVPEVRRSAAAHPLMDADRLSLLVRAGSSADLARLAAPDASITSTDLDELAGGGYWARQLAVRHADTSSGTLARLLCDDDPKIREWAAAHPNLSSDVVDLLRRAGAAHDFQGIAPADPEMSLDDLRRVADLGPYGEMVVSWHPKGARPDA